MNMQKTPEASVRGGMSGFAHHPFSVIIIYLQKCSHTCDFNGMGGFLSYSVSTVAIVAD